MKRLQLWANLLNQIRNEVIQGVTPESTYYYYCSKFIEMVYPYGQKI